ncbi:MAG TPA: CvpA family protein, partial [Bacteroidales bacterium]|nr:CvpA family protein [Bacteroidales bacterium]
SRFIKLIMLGWLDKLLGALLAILKCAVIISVLIYILNSLNTHLNFIPQSILSQSKVYSFVGKIAPKIYPYFEKIPDIKELVDI